MVTVEELLALPAGTPLYVASPGRGPKRLWANYLAEETFAKVIKTAGGEHLGVGSGGYSMASVRDGEALFLDKDDAESYMRQIHIEKYNLELNRLAGQIEELQSHLDKLRSIGPGEPNYIYHTRGDSSQ